ncbi:cytochrome P450 sterol C-22 desaturase [Capsaspora owczarzaki ATCC 30864]|uniref:sterol 22-desaturase n=1 Tax=Capsaspora owczarzaki (strain ATCC 30864) TaxID=595528 RepID=A0A0D2U002_CAPO3|nr:cytochrome P450 sterol C-22 desaturase [Capsaspora owczarzaki ATCC 30864]KJE88501.1 cytochrome P450 sterol C-22 desaturase [Capsaspora owczarzaki ATCC 30864]|eukprot:XP_004365021.1 cytochrome P450 sterol C-22 desaturase [Capsaspora owczarzaki ATCC 30864]
MSHSKPLESSQGPLAYLQSNAGFVASTVVALGVAAAIVTRDAASKNAATVSAAIQNSTAAPQGFLMTQIDALSKLVDSHLDVTPLTFKLAIAVLVLGAILLLDQINYRRRKQSLPGPKWVPPLIGFFYDSVNPKFEGYMAQWNLGRISFTSVFQHFIMIGSDNDISRYFFNTPGSFVPCLVASMKTIICPDNFVFLGGKAHVEYRKSLNPLFTPAALTSYLPLQFESYQKHVDMWLENKGKSLQYQIPIRELNMDTSLNVFCGKYMPDDVRMKISERYYDITAALQLVNFPFAFPGTNVYRAVQARKYIVSEIQKCVVLARASMAKGNPSTCLLDTWLQTQLAAKAKADAAEDDENFVPPRQFSDAEMALVVLTFIFASQDASTASVTWMLQCLADNPDVLAKVREENARVRPNNEPVSGDNVKDLVYTRQVAKEVLRYRPPVIMVPYAASKDVVLEDGTKIANGTIVIPSIYPSLHDPKVYANPDKFDPDRFGPERQEDIKSPRNWLVFGHGTHLCLGREYAVSHLLAFMAYISMRCDWKHNRTAESDDITVFATIYPKDQLHLEVTERTA